MLAPVASSRTPSVLSGPSRANPEPEGEAAAPFDAVMERLIRPLAKTKLAKDNKSEDSDDCPKARKFSTQATDPAQVSTPLPVLLQPFVSFVQFASPPPEVPDVPAGSQGAPAPSPSATAAACSAEIGNRSYQASAK